MTLAPSPTVTRLQVLAFVIGLTAAWDVSLVFGLQFSAPSGGNGFSNQPNSSVDAPQTTCLLYTSPSPRDRG